MACVTLDSFVLEFGKGEKHGTSIQKAERVLRQDRLCAVGRRRVRWPWQHLAFPVSGGQVWRRHLSVHLHSAGVYVRLYHDRGGDGSGPDDQEEPGGRFRGLWQKGRALVRRLDQRHHPHPHRALLLGHWRLGHPVPGGLRCRARQGAGHGRLFLVVHLQWCFGGDLLCHLHHLHAGDHLCGRPQRRGTGLQSHDAHSGGAFRHHCGLLRHPARGAGGCEVFPRAQCRPFLLDDRRHGHGADVLFPVHRHGHSGHVRLLYEKGRLD